MQGDSLENLSLSDQLIFNAAGHLVGVKNPKFLGNDLRFDPASLNATGGSAANLRLSSCALPALALSLPAGPLSVGCIGDSIVRNQIAGLTGNKAAVGNTIALSSRAWAFLACALSGRRLWLDTLAVEGYSGYRTDQVFASMLPSTFTITTGPTDSGTVPYGVLARKPNLCFDMSGTNDSEMGVAVADFLQAKRALWSRLLNAGILPIAISQLPRNAPASAAAQVATFNSALSALAREWGVPFIDVYTNCASGTGWKPGYDWYNGAEDAAGLHPGPLACQSMAQDIWSQLAYYLGTNRTTPTIYSSTNYLTATGSQSVTAAAVAAGGTGYAVGDTIVLANNNRATPQTAAVLQVATVNAGAVATVNVLSGGLYPTVPGNPVAQQASYALGNPTVASGTGATFNLTLGSTWDSARKGDSFSDFDSGLFTSTAGWTPRYDPNAAASVSVGADSLAQYGNALISRVAAPGAGNNYVDYWGPGTVTVAAGQKYGFFGRVSFAAGSSQDSLSVGLQGSATVGANLWQFASGSTDNSGYNATGASLPALDFYQEIVIPPTVTVVRPFVVSYTYPGAGSTLKLAQLGMVRLN